MTTSGSVATADAQLLRNASSYELHNFPPWFECRFSQSCWRPSGVEVLGISRAVESRLKTTTKGLGLDPDSVSDWPGLRFLIKASRDLVNTAVTDNK